MQIYVHGKTHPTPRSMETLLLTDQLRLSHISACNLICRFLCDGIIHPCP